MDLMSIKRLKDFRDKLAKHSTRLYATRALSSITNIAVHHSLTKTGSAESFSRYHVSNSGWPGIGYHFVIEQDGLIKWTNNLETVSYHVGNSNRKAVGICLTGDFREHDPTGDQWESLFELIRHLMLELSLAHDSVLGHSEFPGYESKACPCIDMTYVRQKLLKHANDEPSPAHNSVVLKNGNWVLETLNRFPFLSPGSIRKLNPTLSGTLLRPTPVVVKGDVHKVPDRIQHIIRAMEARGYKVFRESKKNFRLNIVGIRNSMSRPGLFSDRIIVFWLYEGRWHHREYEATTDPGLYYLNSPLGQKRNIILDEGQYLHAFRLGRGSMQLKTLMQAQPVSVSRDFMRSSLLFTRASKRHKGFFDIGFYHAIAPGSDGARHKWPGANQLFASAKDYSEFIKLCENAVLNWDNSFTYTLLSKNQI